MLDETEDQRLALKAASGDRAAFERLVRENYERIHGLAWRFTGGPPESEDLTQDVCMALGRKIRSFRGDALFTTWLYRIILNASRDARRSDLRRDRASSEFVEVDADRRASDDDRARRAAWLRFAIAGLKDDLRETAVLVIDQGLTHAEAAEVLQLSEGTVSWRFAEIRKTLRRLAVAEGTV